MISEKILIPIIKVLVLILGFIVLKVLKRKIYGLIERLSKITKTDLDEIIFNNIKDIIWYLIVVLYFNIALSNLFLYEYSKYNLSSYFKVIFIILASFALFKVLDILVEYFSKKPELLKVKDERLFRTAIDIIGNLRNMRIYGYIK